MLPTLRAVPPMLRGPKSSDAADHNSKALAKASSAEVPPKERESAQRVLEFELLQLQGREAGSQEPTLSERKQQMTTPISCVELCLAGEARETFGCSNFQPWVCLQDRCHDSRA